MTESEFNQCVDELLIRIEDAIEASGAAIDCEAAGGILTLGFEDDSQIIINRQTPLQQIWVASREGGFHFDYDEDSARWLLPDGETELFEALSRFCSRQAGETVSLKEDAA